MKPKPKPKGIIPVEAEESGVKQTQQQRPESPTVTLIWHASKYKVRNLHQRYIIFKKKQRKKKKAFTLLTDL